ncbi:MAG TPA: lamin tail domain-containing protein [Thermoanaerobaculia bacterium]
MSLLGLLAGLYRDVIEPWASEEEQQRPGKTRGPPPDASTSGTAVAPPVTDDLSADRSDDGTREVIISEIAWMGTSDNPADEWIELRNTTSRSIALTGWELNADTGVPRIRLKGTLRPNAHFLLERSDDGTVPGVKADQIYKGPLVDTGEILELRDAQGRLIDRAGSSGSWFAGSKSPRASMCRGDPTVPGTSERGWYTATTPYAGGLGTPKAPNAAGGR